MAPKNSKPPKGKNKPQEEQREEYLQAVVNQDASKWMRKSSPFVSFRVLRSTGTSVGDIMRDLDRQDLITGDFLLVSGDVISNMNLELALAQHRARREKSKDAIMTMILREAGIGHRTKSSGSRPVFVLDPAAERCVHYEEMGRRRTGSRYLTLDPELLAAHGELEVREDLIDCHVDICTMDVLAQWSDNYDFQSLRNDFLCGVLKDYETYGKTIHTHVVKDQYATRIKSLRAYNAVTKDVMGRWVYPLCPDSNLGPDQSYTLGRNKTYQEDGVMLGRTTAVKRCIIGSESRIGDGSVISASTIGRRCKIGRNVTIDGAYVWDDVTIEDGSIVQQSIIANGTSIGKSCRIEPGALISFEVQLKDGATVVAGERVTQAQMDDPHTKADQVDSDTSSAASAHLVYSNRSASSSVSSISTLASSNADFEPREASTRRSSFRSDPSDDVAENRDFHVEATASILDGLQNEALPDTIMLELSGYRMSTNASQHEVRKAVVTAFIKRISNLLGGDNGIGISMREAVHQVFKAYQSLVERTTFDKDVEQKVDQVDFLITVQKEAIGRPNGDQLLLFVAKEMYDLEIIEEDGVLQWWEDTRSYEGEMGKVRGLTEQFITYLKEAEEDEESSEEEDNDDGDDDE
ncbi:translation initiation factor eIF-2B subunit epsilon, partial [Lecanoromycetidae sp. Uapishka_2]